MVPSSLLMVVFLPLIPRLKSYFRVLKDPEMESASAWEMLWNDPLSKKGALPLLKALSGTKLNAQDAEDKKRGFLFNEKRGTAFYFQELNSTFRNCILLSGTAFYFQEKSVDTFLSINTLSHIIRAHEVIQEGYKFHFQGKCFTVFSTSNYQGAKNTAACVLVKDEQIRPVSIET